MKGCFKVFLCIFVGVPAAIAALITLGVWWHSASVRYRLTLVVEAGGQERTGSGVLRTECEDTEWLFAGLGESSCWISGEAIPIDLGARGFLFVTLHDRPIRFDESTDPAYLPWRAFPAAGMDAMGHRFYVSELRALRRDHAKADVPLSLLPVLVRFRNIADPKSVEGVDPDHLDQAFGPGARIVSATIEITDDPVTTGIEKLLPWIDAESLSHSSLDGDLSIARSSNALSNRLSIADFKWGI